MSFRSARISPGDMSPMSGRYLSFAQDACAPAFLSPLGVLRDLTSSRGILGVSSVFLAIRVATASSSLSEERRLFKGTGSRKTNMEVKI